MKETYCSIPEAVLTFPVGEKTDVILRKNIEKVTKQGNSEEESYDAYECDEVQFRYNGTLTIEDIENNFDLEEDNELDSNEDDESSEDTEIDNNIADDESESNNSNDN